MGLQYFSLKLDCGHSFETFACQEHNGEPYQPNYIGQEMPARCCHDTVHVVTEQKKIPRLTGEQQ